MELVMQTPLSSPLPADPHTPTGTQNTLDTEQHAPTFHRDFINIHEFRKYWSQGIPVVVTHVKLQGGWDPASFISAFGEIKVTVQDCETGKTQQKTLEEFFSSFGKLKKSGRISKVKVCEIPSFCSLLSHNCRYSGLAHTAAF
jgi:hypothetical protein